MNQKRAYYIFRVVYPDEVTLSSVQFAIGIAGEGLTQIQQQREFWNIMIM